MEPYNDWDKTWTNSDGEKPEVVPQDPDVNKPVGEGGNGKTVGVIEQIEENKKTIE